ncbi:MAG: TlpA family protein disulfide reductase [Candidatus Sulfotelmatobacter sp.]
MKPTGGWTSGRTPRSCEYRSPGIEAGSARKGTVKSPGCSFLQTVPDTADTPSRSQVVFLASMAQQYGPRGLRVAIVDASDLTLASQPSHDAVLNSSYDWHLNFPLLFDQKGQLARALQVKEVPTTFLVAIDGTIVQRWQGLTRPAVLAQGIERLLGGPLGRMP